MKNLQKAAQTSSLKGLPVLITRPFDQSEELLQKVKALGGAPKIAPVLDICFRDDAVVDRAVMNLSDYDVVVLTSANAIRALYTAGQRLGTELSAVPRWIAISDKTAAAAREFGLEVETYANVHTSAELADTIRAEYKNQNETQFLLARGQLGKTTIRDALTDAGHSVSDCICYDTVEHHLSRDTWQAYLKSERIAILLFSPSAVNSLVKQIGPVPLQRKTIYKIAVGPTTAEACRALELDVTAVAQHPSSESVLEALQRVSGAI